VKAKLPGVRHGAIAVDEGEKRERSLLPNPVGSQTEDMHSSTPNRGGSRPWTIQNADTLGRRIGRGKRFSGRRLVHGIWQTSRSVCFKLRPRGGEGQSPDVDVTVGDDGLRCMKSYERLGSPCRMSSAMARLKRPPR